MDSYSDVHPLDNLPVQGGTRYRPSVKRPPYEHPPPYSPSPAGVLRPPFAARPGVYTNTNRRHNLFDPRQPRSTMTLSLLTEPQQVATEYHLAALYWQHRYMSSWLEFSDAIQALHQHLNVVESRLAAIEQHHVVCQPCSHKLLMR